MARGDYTPEIRTAMGSGKPGRVNTSPSKESPADMARDRKKGIAEGSKQDAGLDALPANQARPKMPPGAVGPMPPVSGASDNLHHITAASGIAHAILNHRGGGM